MCRADFLPNTLNLPSCFLPFPAAVRPAHSAEDLGVSWVLDATWKSSPACYMPGQRLSGAALLDPLSPRFALPRYGNKFLVSRRCAPPYKFHRNNCIANLFTKQRTTYLVGADAPPKNTSVDPSLAHRAVAPSYMKWLGRRRRASRATIVFLTVENFG